MATNPKPIIVPLAVAYFVAELGLDAVAVWIILSHGHPWWALAYCIFAGYSANKGAQRYAGVLAEEPREE